jgi:hypothetical protein
LLSRRHLHPRGDDHERITRARQAAEALFAPKPQVIGPSVSTPLPSADQSARKPRVLASSPPPAPLEVEEVGTPVNPEKQVRPEILVSKFAHIRTLVKYGMTVSQVAEVYGVAVGAIQRVLGRDRADAQYIEPGTFRSKYALTIRFFMVSRVYLTSGIVTQTQLARAVGGGGTLSVNHLRWVNEGRGNTSLPELHAFVIKDRVRQNEIIPPNSSRCGGD